MALIPWRPFFDLERFLDNEDWLMPLFLSAELNKPAMDIKETDKEVIAELAVPGFNPEDIEVSVENGVLRVTGIVKEEKKEEQRGYWRREIRRGSFERLVRLPGEVKEGEIKATYEKGILTIVMPKAKAQSSRKVKVEVKKR